MITYTNPDRSEWESILSRPVLDASGLQELCREVFTSVTLEGDKAVNRYAEKFDGSPVQILELDEKQILKIDNVLSKQLKDSIRTAADNIEKFHQSQIETSQKIETMEGVSCWRENRPIEKTGLYIPGGTAPLFSTVLMLGIPAKIAGVKEIVLCTPPSSDGEIPAVVQYAAYLSGIPKIYMVGGVQAIASMALGTETIPKVYKIFGPGNQYVMAAKQFAMTHGTAIDLPAGPSEVMVIADSGADPSFIASDLLSQAEHGIDSQVVLLTDTPDLIRRTEEEIENQLKQLPRAEIARQALEKSVMISFPSIKECMKMSNMYAPEHLILSMANPSAYTEEIMNAGSVFMGYYAPESAGDYASGTNHTLPTNGYARGYSGVSLDSFIKKITFQQITPDGLRKLGPAIEDMAEAEQLQAHKFAVTVRLNQLKNV